ncbi:MAG: hypothetical protein JJU02_15870, partial [Cryomorphaceae bacterium]|nr:hypothetical protein [Cryomorphaceae bacterium]
EEQGVPVWAQITLGVTLGLKQGRKNITNNRSLKTLPSHKKIKIDKEHILSGHKTGGSRVSMNKDLFPSYMTEKQVIGDIKFAYRSVKKS